jgi:hypothetical protein
MPKKTKPKENSQKETEKTLAETEEIDELAWSCDQQKRSYYYDDAHGYEIYKPDEDEEKEI